MDDPNLDGRMCPDRETGARRFKVLRVRPRVLYRGFCCSDCLVLAATHFLRGRTVPCLVRECPGCVRGLPRVYAYVGWQYGGGVGVLELPERTAVEALGKLSGSAPLLGRSLRAWREKGPRSAVRAEFGDVVENVTFARVSRQEIRAALCRLWGLPVLVATGEDDLAALDAWREEVRLVLAEDEHFPKRGKGGGNGRA